MQRIIGAHEGVATASEPWLLLPHAYTLRQQGVDAEYVHPLLFEAIGDFCEGLPGGGEDYVAEMRDFILRLYEKSAGEDATYFLDRRPERLVTEEIMRLFPEGEFVFLWRNPLSVVASLIGTWGPWYPTFMSSDLFIGLPRLVAAYESNRDRVHTARFEDLSGGDEVRWRALMDYLGIDFEPDALASFAKVELGGRMGDPTGAKRYSALSSEPQQKWKRRLRTRSAASGLAATFASSARSAWPRWCGLDHSSASWIPGRQASSPSFRTSGRSSRTWRRSRSGCGHATAGLGIQT